MKPLALLLALLGLLGVLALISWQGAGAVAEALRAAGLGLLVLVAWFPLPLALASESWRVLVVPEARPRFLSALRASWVGFAVNWLLPVGQVGGDLVKGRLISHQGTPGHEALASVVVDKTIQVATTLTFTLVGLALLASRGLERSTGLAVGGGTLLLGLALLAFHRVQRRGGVAVGARWMERLPVLRGRLQSGADRVHEALNATWERRGDVRVSFFLRLGFRFLLAGEIYLAAQLLGAPITVLEAVLIESLVQAVRAGAFLVPGGLGAQEGAFLLLGGAVGWTGDVALAVALCKRFRELAVGLPGLVAGSLTEGRGWIARANPLEMDDGVAAPSQFGEAASSAPRKSR